MGRKRQEDNEKEKDRAGGKGRVKSGWNRLENNNEREKGATMDQDGNRNKPMM